MVNVQDGATIYTHTVKQLLAYLLNPVFLIRAFCLASITAISITWLVPVSRQRFLKYGARGQPLQRTRVDIDGHDAQGFTSFLDRIASLDVPHGWFTHFYLTSLVLSAFWLTQVTFNTKILCFISESVTRQDPPTSKEATLVAMCLMFAQSIRRLGESFVFSQGSSSRMWIGHYVFGLAFYCFANVAVWIEGLHSIVDSNATDYHWMQLLSVPRCILGLTLFVLSSVCQGMAHTHLASLPRYSVPRHWLFKWVICPHYTAECAIYFSLAIVAAPAGKWLNDSLLWIVLLTAINLGITASGTKSWMIAKFRESENDIRGKWCMLPGIW